MSDSTYVRIQAKYGDDEELRYVESNAIRSYIEGLVQHGPKVGKWTKKSLAEYICVGGLGFTPVGTPEMVVDEMEQWVAQADVDGFNIVSLLRYVFQSHLMKSDDDHQAYAIMPQTFQDVISMLIPELRKRGLFWDGYKVPGGTYRENLFERPGQTEPLPEHPASKFAWDPPSCCGIMENVTVNGYGRPDSPQLDPVAMQLS